jgi:hypothetical protein
VPVPSDTAALEPVAVAASHLARQIREWIPIVGAPWMSEIHEPHIVNNVVNAAVSLERALRAVPQPLWAGAAAGAAGVATSPMPAWTASPRSRVHTPTLFSGRESPTWRLHVAIGGLNMSGNQDDCLFLHVLR